MKRFVAILLVLSLSILFLSCNDKKTGFGWTDIENDVSRLEEIGYAVIEDNNPDVVDVSNDIVKSELQHAGEKDDVRLVGICSLNKEYDKVVSYYEFDDAEQAKRYYDFKLRSISEDRETKFALIGAFVIMANDDETIELLKYDFK